MKTLAGVFTGFCLAVAPVSSLMGLRDDALMYAVLAVAWACLVIAASLGERK